jgi:hypothetical protein
LLHQEKSGNPVPLHLWCDSSAQFWSIILSSPYVCTYIQAVVTSIDIFPEDISSTFIDEISQSEAISQQGCNCMLELRQVSRMWKRLDQGCQIFLATT